VVRTTIKDLDLERDPVTLIRYKNAVGARRASWRTLILDEYKGNSLIDEYKKKVMKQID